MIFSAYCKEIALSIWLLHQTIQWHPKYLADTARFPQKVPDLAQIPVSLISDI
jgi:hypothetical protein